MLPRRWLICFPAINAGAEESNYSICWYINIHNCVYWNTWSFTWWKCNIGFEIFSSVQTVIIIWLYYANGHFTKIQVIKWQQNVAVLCHFLPVESQWYIKSIIFTILQGEILLNNYHPDLIHFSEDLAGADVTDVIHRLHYGDV